MRAHLQQIFYRIQGSYWFVPSLMLVSAIVLSQLSIRVDRSFGAEWLSDVWFATHNQPEGARSLLATVAGSMITVAGVTFSLTLLAVSHATSLYGPRLLDSFMRDRGNQLTLGTFVSTFIYCLLVLQVVRNSSIGSPDVEAIPAFVPQFSLLIAIGLTLASVAQLVFFIHHVPEQIHVSTVLQRLAGDMNKLIESLYPETIAGSAEKAKPHVPDFQRTVTVCSAKSGYLQGVDDEHLLAFVVKRDGVIRFCCQPGDFIRLGQPLAELDIAGGWTEQEDREIRFGFTIGFTRTPTQDLFFVLNEFVEVAARALSPGVNDPFTAMQCIDWLSDGMVRLSQRRIPSRFRVDDDDVVRIITTDIDASDYAESIFGQLIPYAREDENVSRYLCESLRKIVEISDNEAINQAVTDLLHRLEST